MSNQPLTQLIETLCSCINLRFPSSTILPPTMHWTPLPGKASKLSDSGTSILSDSAFARIASAKGCSEPFSAAPAYRKTACVSVVVVGFDVGYAWFSLRKVPVLSNTTVVSFLAFSTYSPLRRSTPYSAPFPTPARMAVGVAMPKAHGQEINSTASKTKNAVASCRLLCTSS